MTGEQLALLGLAVTVVGVIWKAGRQMGELSETLKVLSKAVEKNSGLGDRVLVLETKLGIKHDE